jgi:hypothetical protein
MKRFKIYYFKTLRLYMISKDFGSIMIDAIDDYIEEITTI